MATSDEEFGEAVVREVVRTVGYWVAGLTGLFLFFHLGPVDPAVAIVGPQASQEMLAQVRQQLDLSDPLAVQWLDWMVSATLLDYGQSYVVARGVPVRDLIFEGLGASLKVLVGAAVTAVVIGVPSLRAVDELRDRGAGTAATAVGAVASAAAPVLVLFAVLWLASSLEFLPMIWNRRDGELGRRLLAVLLLGVTLAIPLVGIAARRYRTSLERVRADGAGSALEIILAPDERQFWSLDLWLLGAYAAGALVLVEVVFAVPGLGRLFATGVISGDVLLVLGVGAFVLQVGVVLRLVGVIGVLAADDVIDVGAAGHPTEDPTRADGGQSAREGVRPTSDPGDVIRRVTAAETTRLGAVGLVAALLLGLLGSVLLAPEQPDIGQVAVGFAPGHLLNSLGTYAVVVLLATTTATLVGATFGIASALLGRPIASVLRVPADLFLLVPLQVVVLLWIGFSGSPTDRLGFELVVGTLAGLVLAGYAFHVARRGATGRFRAAGDGEPIVPATEAGVVAVGRTLGVAPLVVFVAAELAFLGLTSGPDTLSSVAQLTRVRPYLATGQFGMTVGAFATAAIPVGLVTAPLALLGDGLAASQPAPARPTTERAEATPAAEAESGESDEPAADAGAMADDEEPAPKPDAAPSTEPADATGDEAAAAETTDQAEPSEAEPADATDAEPAEARVPDPSGGEADRRDDRVGPPTDIPQAPKLSVDYDAIERVERLGTGGNADVHLVRVGGQELALKEPRFDDTMHASHVERFLEEAETWAKLDDGDHVVGVVDYDEAPLPWLSMEYMDAGHLGTVAGDLPLDRALWTAVSVVRGVNHAHRRGVAHLDLKPANVLLRSVEGAWDVPKVADWGLAKLMLDHSHSVEGFSPQYAAPEQFDPDAYGRTDQVTDVYQLGAVFYELFTGETPFEGQSARVMHAVLNDDPTPPSELDPELPPGLDDVLLGCLAKEKGDRYETVLYLRDDLQELYEDVRDGR